MDDAAAAGERNRAAEGVLAGEAVKYGVGESFGRCLHRLGEQSRRGRAAEEQAAIDVHENGTYLETRLN